MEICLLGPLLVTGVDGIDVTPRAPKERALLALLAIDRGRVVSTDRLVEELWPELPPDRGRHVLQVRVAAIRKRLARAGVSAQLESVPPGYLLGAGSVDARRFEDLVVRGTGADPAERVELLSEALAMWRGEALVEFADQEWAVGEAVRLAELRWSASEDRIEALLAVGRLGEAAADAEALALGQPLRERVRGLQMRALASQGRVGEALRVFQDYRAHVAEEIGVEPSAELEQLERRIIAGDVPAVAAGAIAARRGGPPPTGTVTFLFTDIEGSTQYWENEPDGMQLALEVHDRIVREAIEGHGGYVFNTAGDGFAAAFGRAADAVAAAIEAQRCLAGASWPGDRHLAVRMGLHTGEAAERDGDYFGAAVNLAARLVAAGHGGQVLVSGTTAQVVEASLSLDDLGEHRLRDVSAPVRVHQVVADGLAASFPALRTQLPGNLVRPVTPWFGSAGDMERLAASLRDHRLVTLTGPGGVGKTRAAVEVGGAVTSQFVDGVWFVDLAPITDGDSLLAEVAGTLSIRLQPTPVVEAIVERLHGRRLLLILDNCEHLLRSAAALVETVMGRCPSVVVLATSREPLGVSGERVVTVPSMRLPDAVALFCDRAGDVDDTLVLTEADHASVGAICERLDGIPLAIELAAARMRASTPGDLLARLEDRFRVLRGGGRSGLERQQTIHATVTWSYQLLDEQERILFDRLSVFAGSFDLAGACAVCADDAVPSAEVVDVLESLVNKSMVAIDRTGGDLRYRLLETLRQYGEQRLAEHGDPGTVRDRHLDHYQQLAGRARTAWASPDQAHANTWFAREWDNLRAAVQLAVATGDVEAATSLIDHTAPYARGSHQRAHSDWTDTVLDMASQDRPLVRTIGWAALWRFHLSGNDAAIEAARRGIRLQRRPDDPEATLCRAVLMSSLLVTGRGEEAHTMAATAATTAAALADPFDRLWTERGLIEDAFWNDLTAAPERVRAFTGWANEIGAPSFLAWAMFAQGRVKAWIDHPPDYQGAIACSREGLTLGRMGGDIGVESNCLIGLAFVNLTVRSPAAAANCREALSALLETRSWNGIWLLVDAIARWLSDLERLEEAAVIHGHMQAHHPTWGESARQGRADVFAKVQQLERAEELMAIGAEMSNDDLVAYLLEQL